MDAEQNSSGGATTTTSEPKADISKTTLIVLVLLTLVISVIGTWSVLQEVNSIRPVQEPSSTTATVRFALYSNQNVEPTLSQPESGSIAFTVV